MKPMFLKISWLTLMSAFLLSMFPLAVQQASGGNTASAQARSRQRGKLRKRTATDTSLVALGTQVKVRLNDTISSKEARVGDRFTAEVNTPHRLEGATVTGHVSSLHKSGRVEGRTTIGLAFDSIRLRDGRSGPMHGQLVRVYESDSVKTVDEEGNVQSHSRGKQTLKRSGIGAAAGAVIGGIAGGGKGAAIGLILGGAAGAGSIAIGGSKELRLEPGTEILLRVTR
jgi:hypothetical protein